jgi:pimeloyl-ACP methyl ester carboxylesterase
MAYLGDNDVHGSGYRIPPAAMPGPGTCVGGRRRVAHCRRPALRAKVGLADWIGRHPKSKEWRMNWLLLRGLIREQRHWKGLPDVFESLVDGAKVFCLDHPGIGTERHRPSPRSVPGIMADVRRRWLDLREAHPGDWSVYSVSLGSMVGLNWVQTHPGDFRRIVVTGTSVANLSPLFQRFKADNIHLVPRIFVTEDGYTRERAVLRATVSDRTPIDDLAREYADFSLDLPTLRRTGLSQLFAASRLKLQPGMPIPLLVLNALGDKLVDPRCSERVAAYFKAPLISHPWAGHDLPLEDPEWVANTVNHWVKAN